MTPNELELRLRQFLPSSIRHEHRTGLHFSDGIHYLVNNYEFDWLIVAIAHHQTDPVLQMIAELKRFQSWELSNAANPYLYCFRNTLQQTTPAISQPLWSNQFPLEALQLFLIEGVLMLPSEYDG